MRCREAHLSSIAIASAFAEASKIGELSGQGVRFCCSRKGAAPPKRLIEALSAQIRLEYVRGAIRLIAR
jgi:hypothetical protein